MAIVLSMIEDDFIDRDLSLDSPVISYRRVSRDLACRETMRLKDGRNLTAVDLQREFLDLAHRYYRDREHEPWVQDVLARWGSVLDRLARDPMSLDRELDWVVKRHLIENYMGKHDLDWADARVAMIEVVLAHVVLDEVPLDDPVELAIEAHGVAGEPIEHRAPARQHVLHPRLVLARAVVPVRHLEELALHVHRGEGAPVLELDRLPAVEIAGDAAVRDDRALEREV